MGKMHAESWTRVGMPSTWLGQKLKAFKCGDAADSYTHPEAKQMHARRLRSGLTVKALRTFEDLTEVSIELGETRHAGTFRGWVPSAVLKPAEVYPARTQKLKKKANAKAWRRAAAAARPESEQSAVEMATMQA